MESYSVAGGLMRPWAKKSLSKQNKAFSKALEAPIVELYHYNGCGFFDGGCLLLADALNIWSSGQIRLAAIGRSRLEGAADHWVGQFELNGQSVFIDANGIQSGQDLLRYWEQEELREPVVLIGGALSIVDSDSEIPRDLVFSSRICRAIEDELGQFKPWREQLEAILSPGTTSLSP